MTGLRPGLRRPQEGWTVLALVAAMALILAWAVDDPAYVNGRGALTDGLALCALAGVAVGFVGPKVGWGRWTTHGIGALFAALVIPVIAGWAVLPGSTVGEAFRATATGSVDAYLDLAWRGMPLTDQEVHYIVVLGAILWGTMQFASHAVFGHGRPMSAIVVAGVVLLANMGLTGRDQLTYLIAYVAASLFLLIEMHAFDERATWLRRRIGDPSQISALYLRGGTVFIVIAMAGSLLLTQRAASAPLEGAWDGVNDQLVRVGEEISRLFPVGGDIRGGGGVTFGPTAQIASRWFGGEEVAYTATVPSEAEHERWRAATYDTFALFYWVQTTVTAVPVEAGQPLLAGTPEAPDPALTRATRITVRPDTYHDSLLVAPGTPTSVDRAANTLLAGTDGWFAGIDRRDGAGEYTVETSLLRFEEDAVTGNRLAAAGEAYPPDIALRYTNVPEGAIGEDATELLESIVAEAGTLNPYDLAVAMQDYLRSDRFTYNTDLSGVPCDARSAVECFARTTQGYCLHYASTMAILLRAANPDNRIPTRLVQGFLPGERLGAIETVRSRNAHAWVEVYFPGYGWIPFDPTGDVGVATQIPAGPPVASAAPSASAGASLGPDEEDPRRTPVGLPAGELQPPAGGGIGERGILIVLTVVLGVTVLAVGLLAWARGPRGEVSPETAWQALSRTASRFGFGPRPTQTVYEYASSLGELVPVAEHDLQVVAAAKVETTYARVRLGGARLDAVRDAARRLRVSLLRLALRRVGRRRRR